MQVLNGKQSTITFKLDNGEIVKVKPGEISKGFSPSVFQLQTIIAMGNPEELAIILSSSYELSVLSQLNGSMAYLKANEQDARAAILEGKDLTPEVISSDNVEINQLKEKLADKEKTISELTEELTKKSEELANSPIGEYKSNLEVKNAELEKLTESINQLTEKFNKLTSDYNDKCNEVKKLSLEKDQAEAKVAELNDKISEAVNSNSVEVSELTKKLADSDAKIKELESVSQSGVAQSDYDDLKSKYDALQEENNNLKTDGAKLVENYKKAKDALVGVMHKFGITYENGEYVMVTNSAE